MRIPVAVFALLLVLGNLCVYGESVLLTREELLKGLEDNIVLDRRGFDDFDEEDKQTFIEAIRREISDVGLDLLDRQIAISTPARAEEILSRAFRVTQKDLEYNRAEIEAWIKGIKVSLAYEKMLTPLTDAQMGAVKDSLALVMSNVANSMTESLAGLFTEDEITQYCDRARESLEKRMADPLTYYFRNPLSDRQVQGISEEFNLRLENSVDRARKRIEKAGKGEDPEKNAARLEATKQTIMAEILDRVSEVMADGTSDKTFAEIDPDSLEPGYTASLARVTEIKKALDQKELARLKKEDESRRSEELQAKIMAAVDGTVGEIEKDIAEDPVLMRSAADNTVAARNPTEPVVGNKEQDNLVLDETKRVSFLPVIAIIGAFLALWLMIRRRAPGAGPE